MKEKKKDNGAFPFLGRGEMGDLIRKKQWDKSVLGALSNWPQSLKTALSIILNSRSPMFLFWGSELICFYNDAYRPSLGNEEMHPRILGLPAQEAWKEVWEIVKQYPEQILSTGKATYVEDQLIPIYRDGKTEDVYWTLSHSPVYDDAGNIEGIFVVCVETTDKVVTIARMVATAEQYELVVDAAELATWDASLNNKVRANEKLREWFNLTHDQEISMATTFDCIADEDKEKFQKALQKATTDPDSPTFDLEYSLIHPVTKARRIVRGRGKTYFVDTQPVRFIGTLQDITVQVMARKKTEQQESELREVADSLPQFVWTTDANGRQTFASSRWKHFTGLDPHDEASFAKMVHPDDMEDIQRAWSASLATGDAYKHEVRLRNKNGKYHWFFVHGEPVRNADNSIEKWIGAFTEITEKKEAEEELKRFKFMVDNAHEKFMLIREDGSFNYVNQLAVEHWGYSRKELKSITALDIYAELTKDDFEQLFSKAQRGVVQSLETVHRTKDGTVYPVEINLGKLTINAKPHIFVVARNISESKAALAKIKENEERLQLVIDASDLGMWEYDLLGNEIIFSKRFLTVYGYDETATPTHEELLRQIHPDDIPSRAKAHRDAIKNGVLHYQARLFWKDGTQHWMEVQGKVSYDDNTIAVAMIGTIRDITEEKSYQQIIEESEVRFRTVADTAPVLIWMSGTDTQCYFFNKAWLDFTGRTMEQEYGNGWADGVHPDDLQRCLDIYLSSFMKRESFYMEYRLRRHDGQYRWLSDNGTARFTPDGNFEGFIGACMDVHERTLFSDELTRSELKFRLLADFMPQFIWTGAPDGVLNYFNDAVYRYSGLTPEEIASAGWLQIVHQDDRELNIELWVKSIQTGDPFLMEHRFRRHDGEYRWQLSRAIPQRDEHGVIQMWVGTSTDIHDRKIFTDNLENEVLKRTEQLYLLNEDLTKSNKELAQFAYVASHDLQEPLRKIQTFGSRILDGENNLTERNRDYFQRMQAAATRMQQLILDLLSYSRVNTADKHYKQTDLSALLNEVLEQLSDPLEKQKAVVDVSALPTAEVIPYQIEQLFTNLITNALKFTKPDQPLHLIIDYALVKSDVLAHREAKPNMDYHRIRVRDNGIGFESVYKDKIFQVFQRLHVRAEYEGTGIGLAICKRILENHDGFIEAASEPNQGATFSLYLPKKIAR